MLEVLLDNDTTRISFINNNTDTVFVCFNSLGIINPDELDFYSLSKYFSILFVTDKTSSWGNHLDWESVSKIVNPIIDGKTSYSIGVSMGGSNSIISSNYINTQYVVAFNPQFTIYPGIAPEDSEYLVHAESIKEWKHKTIEDSFLNKKTFYTFISRNDVNDFLFVDKYPKHVFDCGYGYGHNLAFDLKNAGLLGGLLGIIVEGPKAISKYINTKINNTEGR